ncbi:calcium/sodium antiporter [Motilimonas sp. KMU-193]|uniref:calcium/sodium antiporter n=1 Tax=Motilimonas sp. KMU-193 TaxID=3388668 RepID=UPI00396B070E
MVYLLLVVGLGLLIYGADCLVKGAARLALSVGIPSLVVGLTVVAFGTSAPELAVSIGAAFSGETEMAIANVVGSNVFNVLFILGLAAMLSPLIISKQLIKQDVPIMIAITALAYWLVSDGLLSRLDASILVVLLVSYTVFLFVQGKKNPDPESENEEESAPWWQNILWLLLGVALLVVGANMLVSSAVAIAKAFGVSEAVIGLTIIAIGTSLPEVVTSIVATVKGQRDIAVGNVIGSNVFNLLAVLGVAGVIAPEGLAANTQLVSLDIPIMLGVALLCAPLFFTGASLSRAEGATFFMLYLLYTSYLLGVALNLSYTNTLGSVTLYVVLPITLSLVSYSLFRDIRQRA